MDSYHKRLLKYDHMYQPQFNEAHKAKHVIIKFPSAPTVAYTFVQVARLSAQHQSKQDQRNATDGRTLGTQEDNHKTQWVTLNERLVNAPTSKT